MVQCIKWYAPAEAWFEYPVKLNASIYILLACLSSRTRFKMPLLK